MITGEPHPGIPLDEVVFDPTHIEGAEPTAKGEVETPEATQPAVEGGKVITLPYDSPEWLAARAREQRRATLLVAQVVAGFCVYGKPELTESIMTRFRKNIEPVVLAINGLRIVPTEGPARVRLAGLVAKARKTNAELEPQKTYAELQREKAKSAKDVAKNSNIVSASRDRRR